MCVCVRVCASVLYDLCAPISPKHTLTHTFLLFCTYSAVSDFNREQNTQIAIVGAAVAAVVAAVAIVV